MIQPLESLLSRNGRLSLSSLRRCSSATSDSPSLVYNEYTFKWQNKTYQIINPPGDIINQDVGLRFYPNGESSTYFAERKLEVT